jgi:hypothetical protein
MKARGLLTCPLILSGLGAVTANSAPLSLLLPQSIGFSFLGHWCGGIQEMSYATGFDPASGLPTGYVYIQTRCGGSGRGGGYHSTTYSAWVNVTWDFEGNVKSYSRQSIVPPVNSTFAATDADGDQIYNSSGRAYLTVPAPSPPSEVTAVQSGDEFEVSWTPASANPEAIISSTLTAAPVAGTAPVFGSMVSGPAPYTASQSAISTRREKRAIPAPFNSSAPVLTTTVSGPATTGIIASLQPHTTYHITVVSTTIGGSSRPSAPISVTTEAASVVPSAPTGVTIRWGAQAATTAALLLNWNAAVPGDSPVDRYQLMINGSDGGGTFTQIVSGVSLEASFTVDSTPDWTITLRAHNAAGWGAWSTPITVGGL